MVNVPDLSDGDVLNASECFKFHQEDSTGGSSNLAAETSVSQLTIAAGAVTNGILVLVNCDGLVYGANKDCAIKIRVGEDAGTPTNNTLVATATWESATDCFVRRSSGALHRFYNGATWSNTNYVDVTVTTEGDGAGSEGFVTQVTVFVF